MPISEKSQKLAFSLAEPDDVSVQNGKYLATEHLFLNSTFSVKSGGFGGILQAISDNSYFKDFMSLMKIVSELPPAPQAKAVSWILIINLSIKNDI